MNGKAEVLVTVKLRLDWHDRMMFDKELTATEFRIGCAIGWHINKWTGLTFVGRETIAKKFDLNVRSVDRAVSKLEKKGHLVVVRGPGRGHSNHYSIALQQQVEQPDEEEEKATPVSPFKDEQKATSVSVKGDTGVLKRRHQCRPNPVVINPKDINTTDARDDIDLFEDFRKQYPFEPWMSLKAAQAAFKKLSINEQIDACKGASRYAADCVQQRRKVQNVRNWIADRCWEGYVELSCDGDAFDARPGWARPSNGILEARESILADIQGRSGSPPNRYLLPAYSPEWQAFRSERIAAGEDVTYMDDRAKRGEHWDARARKSIGQQRRG